MLNPDEGKDPSAWHWLTRSRAPVAITGAGISAASGLPTLQGEEGGRPLREWFRGEEAKRHVVEYAAAYQRMVSGWLRAKPNAAHRALARKCVRIITQNIDGLHQKAGSHSVIELHGSLRRWRCLDCRRTEAALHRLDRRSLICGMERLDVCGWCKGRLIPDLVLEGEPVRNLARAVNWVSTADALLIVGTTLTRDPVGRFPAIARALDVPVFTVNKDAERRLPQLLAATSEMLDRT